ncbi:cytochrome P450 family protein [Ceratobasidium sp. AG-Ba]|nr:cytochrome P450 family protein [Ceratobasidium sp. AG-Ba]
MLSTPFADISTTTWLAVGTCFSLLIYRLFAPDKLLVALPSPPKEGWMTGHFKKLFGPNGTQYHEHLVSTYGTTSKINGAFGEEIIFTADPTAMHAIFVKDRASFERPTATTMHMRFAFGGGLLSLTGDEHRFHRKLLNPVFTMKFLRELLIRVQMPVFMDIAEQTGDAIKKDLANAKSSSKELDIFPWITAAALDLVGEAGLGYSFDSLTGQRNEYNIAVKSVMRLFSQVAPYAKVMPFLYNFGTAAFRRWAVQYIPLTIVRQMRHVVAVQKEQAEEVLRARQALLSSGSDLSAEAGRGRDIMTLLMKANEAEGSENHIDHQAMIGHMNTFIFAGHETTSTVVSRILNILADSPQIQVKLREEVRLYFEEHKDDVNHDGLLELPYLDAVVRETLRLYGPFAQLVRMSQKDTIIPLEYPIQTPKGEIPSIPVKAGTRILLSVHMANRYGKIWRERANEFWPDRWIGSKLEEVTVAGSHLPGVYSAIMSFGAGPASCIGFKFAVLEIKAMVAVLVKRFKFEPSQHNPSQWEAHVVQFPYLRSDPVNMERIPKLPLRVVEL